MEATGQLKVGKRSALVFGGLVIFLLAFALHIEYLYYMSMALFITPLATWFLGRKALRAVRASRDMHALAKAGERIAMRISLTNTGPMRTGLILVRDHLPSGLQFDGAGERYVMDLAPGDTAAVDYPLLASRRGVYRLGHVELVCTDPLGLFGYREQRATEGLLVVHPRPVPLPRVRPPAAGVVVTSRIRRRHQGDSSDFAGVREYTPGDDLRRIHWKVTAKRGKLTVVEYESGEANNVTVALDLFPRYHAGEGDEHTLEYGVTLAASVASQCLRQGAEFSLVAEGSESYSLRSLISERAELVVMDALARVRADAPRSLPETLLGLENWIPRGSGMVVISPMAGPEAIALARRLVALGHGVLWVSLIAPTFATDGEQTPADEGAYIDLTQGLLAARCAVRHIRRGDDLAVRMGVSIGARRA